MPTRVRVDIALVHYPVYNKNGAVIASAVTNLDLHDIARLAKTYGLGTFYVVTPLKEQQAFAAGILRHWLFGWGKEYNRDRVEALELIRVRDSVDVARKEIEASSGKTPIVLATGARERGPVLGMGAARRLLAGDCPLLLIFGTAWGLAREIVAEADYVLPPVQKDAEYNHLSVRTAAAIVLDRLLGDRE